MRIVKRARFNAHKRMEQKSNASLFSLSMFALYIISISLFPALFEDLLSKHQLKTFTFVAIISSIFIIIVSFIEAMNDYRLRGREMHKCGREVAHLLQTLEATETPRPENLLWFSNTFNSIMNRCEFNHDDVDYRLALAAELRHKKDKRVVDYLSIALANLGFILSIYGLYAMLLLAPFGLYWIVAS